MMTSARQEAPSLRVIIAPPFWPPLLFGFHARSFEAAVIIDLTRLTRDERTDSASQIVRREARRHPRVARDIPRLLADAEAPSDTQTIGTSAAPPSCRGTPE